jgi:hypothetical protein
MRWVWADLFRLGFFAILLVAIVVLRKDCAEGAARFFTSFEAEPGHVPGAAPGSGGIGGAEPRERRAPHGPPGTIDPPPDAGAPAARPIGELRRLTDEEIRRAFPEGLDAGQ